MAAIIKTEFQKIKRYQILLIGLIGMFCSPLLQFFSQMIVVPEARDPHFDFAALIDATIWGNAQIFMPMMFTLIGGYLMNREYTDDTLKNILTIPLSFRKFLAGKLAAVGLLAILMGVYSLLATVIVGLVAGLSGFGGLVLLKGLLQMIGLSIAIYIVVLPLIGICGRRPGMFMSGSVFAFIAGYAVLFFKQGLLRNIYPFSAALTPIGFDTASYSGTSDKGSVPLGIVSLGVMLLLGVLAVCTAGAPGEAVKTGKKKGKKSGGRSAARRGR